MKSRKINIVLIITNIILIGIICSFITKDMNLVKGKQIIKEMTETEYENNITELNKTHTDYANYIQICKTQIATALTNEGITTSDNKKLETMAENISKIFTERTKLDTTVAATENDIIEGKQAYVNGKLISGKLNETNQEILYSNPTAIPTNSSITVNINSDFDYYKIILKNSDNSFGEYIGAILRKGQESNIGFTFYNTSGDRYCRWRNTKVLEDGSAIIFQTAVQGHNQSAPSAAIVGELEPVYVIGCKGDSITDII